MTIHAKGPPRGDAASPIDLSSLAAKNSTVAQSSTENQENNRSSEFTCRSLRAAELRDCLVREISLVMAIGLQAQAALLDGDDEAALGHLRRHWIVMRADVTPMASELGSLLKESP